MATPILLTYADALDHLQTFSGTLGDEKMQRAGREAIQSAYRTIVQAREWRYFYSQRSLALSAPYSTGTVAFDLIGVTYARELTLSSGTWPSWSLYGHIAMDGVVYAVEDRKSNTVLTLDARQCPVADIAAGETYEIFRSNYTLPGDFRKMCAPSPEDSWWASLYVSPADWMNLERHSYTRGSLRAWTLLGDPNLIGSYSLCLWPAPSAAATLNFIYQRSARDLRRNGYEPASSVGTVAGTAGARTITGTSTTFAASMIGEVIRFGDATSLPDGLGGLNPYLEQKVITAVASATSCTVDSNLENNYSGAKYRISSPIDLPTRMIEAFWRAAELEMAILKRMDGTDRAKLMARSALISALESDADVMLRRSAGGGMVFYDRMLDGEFIPE